MATYRVTTKQDAEILAELQVICPSVSAFAWVDGVPQVTWPDAPTCDNKLAVMAYFMRSEFKTMEEVT